MITAPPNDSHNIPFFPGSTWKIEKLKLPTRHLQFDQKLKNLSNDIFTMVSSKDSNLCKNKFLYFQIWQNCFPRNVIVFHLDTQWNVTPCIWAFGERLRNYRNL